MLRPLFAPQAEAPGLVVQLQQAPEFDLRDLIQEVMQYHSMKRKNPVRYLSLEGDEEWTHVPGWWRPNALRGCERKQVYKVHKVPRMEPPFDLQQQFNFDRGNVFEAWLYAYLVAAQRAGIFGITNVRRNLVVADTVTGVGGKYDIVFERWGFTYLIECKSKDDAKATEALKAATEEHRAQHNDYMALTGIHAGFVVYFGIQIGIEDPRTGKVNPNKTGIKIRSFFHRFDPKLWQETLDRVGILELFREDPSRLAPKSRKPFFECEDCPYKGVCDKELSPLAARAALNK